MKEYRNYMYFVKVPDTGIEGCYFEPEYFDEATEAIKFATELVEDDPETRVVVTRVGFDGYDDLGNPDVDYQEDDIIWDSHEEEDYEDEAEEIDDYDFEEAERDARIKFDRDGWDETKPSQAYLEGCKDCKEGCTNEACEKKLHDDLACRKTESKRRVKESFSRWDDYLIKTYGNSHASYEDICDELRDYEPHGREEVSKILDKVVLVMDEYIDQDNYSDYEDSVDFETSIKEVESKGGREKVEVVFNDTLSSLKKSTKFESKKVNKLEENKRGLKEMFFKATSYEDNAARRKFGVSSMVEFLDREIENYLYDYEPEFEELADEGQVTKDMAEKAADECYDYIEDTLLDELFVEESRLNEYKNYVRDYFMCMASLKSCDESLEECGTKIESVNIDDDDDLARKHRRQNMSELIDHEFYRFIDDHEFNTRKEAEEAFKEFYDDGSWLVDNVGVSPKRLPVYKKYIHDLFIDSLEMANEKLEECGTTDVDESVNKARAAKLNTFGGKRPERLNVNSPKSELNETAVIEIDPFDVDWTEVKPTEEE